jgi:ABC-type branched-subunit amino acid transport system permease subunit
LLGIPFVRLRTLYFSMISLFFGAWILYVNSVFSKWTGGFTGIMGIPPIFVGADSRINYYYFFLGLVVVCCAILYRFEFCRIGTTWKAIAQSYLVASSVGINEARQRIIVLTVGSLMVGIAGAAYAHYSGLLAHSTFNVSASINLIIYTFVGGIGIFAGPIIGTAVLILIPEYFSVIKEYVPFLYAGIMLVVVFAIPEGLVGLPEQIRSWLTKRREGKAGSHAS